MDRKSRVPSTEEVVEGRVEDVESTRNREKISSELEGIM